MIGAVLAAAAPSAASAAPGALDTTFSGDGKVTVNLGGANRLGAMALQPNGRAVLGGTGADGTFALARFTSTGALDTSFSGDGKLTTAWPDSTVRLESLYVQPDGKILAAGVGATPDPYEEYWTTTFVAIARYTSSGALDTTFYGDGRFETEQTCDDCGLVHSVAFQPDGRLLVDGDSHESAGRWSSWVERLKPDGTFDGGYYDGCYCLGGAGGYAPFAMQPDGKVVVLGGWTRLKADLSDGDTTYGASDVVTGDVFIQPDGRVLSVGGFDGNGDGDGDLVLGRRRSTGAADTGFGSGGQVVLDRVADEALEDAVQQPNGKIVAVGRSGSSLSLVRLLATGAPDTAFGSTGVASIGFGGATSATGQVVALQGDGKILAAGTAATTDGGDFALARFTGDANPTCNGRAPTIASGFAYLQGSNGADVILGSSGNDTIRGAGGDDTICSSQGSDGVRGGDGNDRIQGGLGNDSLFGEVGNDSLFGEDGNDALDGGVGTDRGDGGAGTDTGTNLETLVSIP